MMVEYLKEELKLAGFFLSLFIGGKITSLIYAQLIGEIIVGAILGPQLVNIVPFSDLWALLGRIGLIYLVFEGGLHVNLTGLRKTGKRAFATALSGTILPVGLGILTFWLIGFDILESVVAAQSGTCSVLYSYFYVEGTVLSSTSIGVTTKLLQQEKQLKTKLGTLLLNAAIIDDVLSLVLLGIITNLSPLSSSCTDSQLPPSAPTSPSSPVALVPTFVPSSLFNPNVSNSSVCHTNTTTIGGGKIAELILVPMFTSIGVVLFGLLLLHIIPRMKEFAGAIVNKKHIPRINIFMMLTLPLLASSGAKAAGSTELLGAFAAGVSFSEVPLAADQWKKWMDELSQILTSIFFASLGFVIPIKQMFDTSSFGYGILYTIPSILGKLVTGLFAFDVKENGFIVGWGMVGRGELGFVMSVDANKEGIFSDQRVAICSLARLLSTIVSPIVFSFLLKRRSDIAESQMTKPGSSSSSSVSESQSRSDVSIECVSTIEES